MPIAVAARREGFGSLAVGTPRENHRCADCLLSQFFFSSSFFSGSGEFGRSHGATGFISRERQIEWPGVKKHGGLMFGWERMFVLSGCLDAKNTIK